jgi:integration host factor subunit alpha
MHDLADTLECAPSIPGLAIPDPPVQAFDFRDDHRLCIPTRRVGRQSARCLLRVPQPHGNVKPIRDLRFLATGLRENRPKARGAVGEGGHLGVGGSTDRLKAPPDHHGDLCVGLRHGAEHLPATAGRLDVADVNHPQTPSQQPIGQSYRLRRHPPHSGHSPANARKPLNDKNFVMENLDDGARCA